MLGAGKSFVKATTTICSGVSFVSAFGLYSTDTKNSVCASSA